MRSEPHKVLVLGSLDSASRIADQLRDGGFEPVLHEAGGGTVPSVADPNGLSGIRGILEDFSRIGAWVHPGTSYWGERPELPAIGQELGLQIIAPPARALALFGNKLNLLDEAERLGIPNLLLSSFPLHSVREVEQQQYSYPFILKAVKGGATAAHYVVHDSEELQSRFSLWMEQLRRNSGEAILLAERYLEGARQILIPFVRFADGRFEAFPAVDVSLHCRHRKTIEFCPAPSLDERMEKQLIRWVSLLGEAAGFVGVGNVEFLVEGERAYLISATARLNRTFPLWENAAGTQAVAWQIAALEGRAPERCPKRMGPDRAWSSSIALRLFAEDPVLQLPQPGTIFEVSTSREWNFPGARAQLDLLFQEGSSVSPTSSGLLGILWVGAADRRSALTAARGVLEQIWIAGSLQTNERFLSELLAHPWVKEGIFHAGFVDEEFLPSVRPPEDHVSLLATAGSLIPLSTPEGSVKSERWAVGDQWAKLLSAPLQWESGPEFFSIAEGPARKMGLKGTLRAPDGSLQRLCFYPLSGEKWQARLGSWFLTVRRARPVAPRAKDAAVTRSHRLLALVAGRVHSIFFREGNTVPAHDPLILIESLGMLIPHALPAEARILRWHVGAEKMVAAGETLAEFEVAAKN